MARSAAKNNRAFLLCLSQVYAGTHCHSERRFLSWFCAKKLRPDECYHITWFMSWSPCMKCAELVAGFLGMYQNVTLSIFTARLYYFQKPQYRKGLLRLSDQGACVDIMSYQGESRGGWGAGRGEG